MLFVSIYKLSKESTHNHTFSYLNRILKRLYSTKFSLNNKQLLLKTDDDDKIELFKKIKRYDYKLLYSSFVEENSVQIGSTQSIVAMKLYNIEKKKLYDDLRNFQPLPISLKYYNGIDINQQENQVSTELNQPVQFPFEDTKVASVEDFDDTDNHSDFYEEEEEIIAATSIDEEIRIRNKMLQNNHTNWMTDYENYDDEIEYTKDNVEMQINYGTPDPKSKISNVPCSGCGALLHCKDSSIPGYVPSEIYKNHSKPGATELNGVICQRCHFLKFYNLALQVRVSPDDYPKILSNISNKRALVILLVDLLDFPCSIWPGIADILSNKIPVIVVGNKVDLLPQSSPKCMQHIKNTLKRTVSEWGFAMSKIKGVCLISAKSGFGVEDLITRLYSLYKERKRDVYIVGCTNVGKSTLFNTLLRSDYCKIQATDLIQRATTSQWPGTTLNLLKFPISRPSGWRHYLRHQRLMSQQKLLSQQHKILTRLQSNPSSIQLPTIVDYVERSQLTKEEVEGSDFFNMDPNIRTSAAVKVGINENDPVYALSSWCFDTPGVVQPDQIIHLLTTDELMLTLPRKFIIPRVFCLKPKTSIFIAGLGRLDYLEGNESIRFIVFRSSDLPITVCSLDVAEEVYNEFLGTEIFKVPINSVERLKKWPGLEPSEEIKVKGKNWDVGSNDMVLSNAGWITVAGKQDADYVFRIWTPEKRGAFSRECLLPYSVKLKGRRISRSPAYNLPNVFRKRS